MRYWIKVITYCGTAANKFTQSTNRFSYFIHSNAEPIQFRVFVCMCDARVRNVYACLIEFHKHSDNIRFITDKWIVHTQKKPTVNVDIAASSIKCECSLFLRKTKLNYSELQMHTNSACYWPPNSMIALNRLVCLSSDRRLKWFIYC